MLATAWEAGIRLFDTAPAYGNGLAEWRLGHALRQRPRGEFLVASKVGRTLEPSLEPVDGGRCVDVPPFRLVLDYGYDAALRSVDQILQRMALSRLDIVFIHDVDTPNFGPEMQKVHFRTAMDGAWRALERLRGEGVVGAIGLGVNEWQVCEAALREADIDCFLLAGRYTLLEQAPLETLLPLCEARGASLLVGGAYQGGILATGPVPGAKYNYKPAPQPIMERVAAIEAVCRRHGVPLAAAALQFPLGHKQVASVLLGTRTVAQFAQNMRLLHHAIPMELWDELRAEGLLHPQAPVPEVSVAFTQATARENSA